MIIETLWLPDLRIGRDTPVTTVRGRIWAGDIQADDFLVFTTYQMPDFEVPVMRNLDIKRDTHLAYCCLKKLAESQGASMKDMMDCPWYVDSWRQDTWLLSSRFFEPYYLPFQEPCWDAHYVRVLAVRSAYLDTVEVVDPVAEAYGLKI